MWKLSIGIAVGAILFGLGLWGTHFEDTVISIAGWVGTFASFAGPSGFGVHHRTWASGVDPKINEPFVRVKV